MASGNPIQDIIGGYYPGNPLYDRRLKRPQGGDSVFEGFDPNMAGYIEEYLFLLEKDLEALDIRKEARKWIIDDVKRSLQKAIAPRDIKERATSDTARLLEQEGDISDIYGFQTSVDINPLEWFKDPEKMAKKTAQRIWNDFANMEDFQTRAETTEIWDKLVKGNTSVAPIAPVIDSLYNSNPAGIPVNNTTAFQMKGLGVKAYKKESFIAKDSQGNNVVRINLVEDDLFADAGAKFIAFQKDSRVTTRRNGNLRMLLDSTVRASAVELADARARGAFTNPADAAMVDKFVQKAEYLRLANAFIGKGNKSTYVLGNETETEFEKGLGSLTEALSKVDLTQNSSALIAAQKEWARFFRGDAHNEPIIKKYVDTADEIKRKFRQYATPEEYQAFLDEIRPVDNLLNSLYAASPNSKWRPQDEVIHDFSKVEAIGEIKNFVEAGNLKGKIDILLNDMTTDSPIQGAIDNLGRSVASTLTDGPLRNIVNNNSQIVGSRNAINTIKQAVGSHRWETGVDLLRRLEKEGFLGFLAKELIWNRIRKRFDGLTPAEIVGRYVKKFDMFGILSISDSKMKKLQKSNSWWSRALTNNRTLDIMDKGVLKKFTFQGDESLHFANDFYRDAYSDNRKTFGSQHAGRRGLRGKGTQLSDRDLVALMNGKDTRKLRQFYSPDELKKLKEKAVAFKAFLLKNNQLGFIIGPNKDVNVELVKSLMRSIHSKQFNNDFTSLFKSHVAIFQKLGSTLSQAQTWIFEKMKFLNPLGYARTVIAKFITNVAASALSKVLGTAITVSTGGIGGAVYYAVEKVVQYTVHKTTEFVSKIVEAFKKADFSVMSEWFEESYQKAGKTFSWLMACGLIGCFLPTMVIMAVFIGAITPIDSTKATFAEDGGGSAVNPGATFLCKDGGCPVSHSDGCFSFQGNWPADAASIMYDGPNNAIDFITNNMGNFVDKLCEAYSDKIVIEWNPSVACGWASSSGNIAFGNGRCWQYVEANQTLFTYLLTHELGHLYHWGVGYEDIETAQRIDGGTMPTYVGPSGTNCTMNMGNTDEDFAETASQIYVWSARCTGDVTYTQFWNGTIPALSYTIGWPENGFAGHRSTARNKIHADTGFQLPIDLPWGAQ